MIPDDEYFEIVHEGSKRWVTLYITDDIFVRERIPFHVMTMPEDQQAFHFTEIARRLKAKVAQMRRRLACVSPSTVSLKRHDFSQHKPDSN